MFERYGERRSPSMRPEGRRREVPGGVLLPHPLRRHAPAWLASRVVASLVVPSGAGSGAATGEATIRVA